MIQRIAVLFAITGTGHVFSIMALKFMAQRGQVTQVAGIGEVESLIQLMIGLIGFGMQSDAIRNITLNSESWEEKFQQAQTARITLSILLMSLSLFSFSDSTYLCFLMAPLFAASSDYALYARGFPVVGTMVAFARVVIPLLMGIISVYHWPLHVVDVYVGATIAIYFITNIFMSLFLKVQLFYVPSFNSLRLYIKTFPLGILTLCFYFFGLGILLVAQLFFSEEELVISFLALKFYLVYKGAIRVIHQAFVSRMTEDRVCLSIDQISIMLGLAFLGSVMIFPNTFISLFFGNQFIDNQMFFVYLAISAIVFSIFNSSATRLILDKRDVDFMKIAIASVGVSVLFLLVIIQFSKSVEMITLSLLVGEGFFAFAIAIYFFSARAIWDRISYLVLCSLALGLPFTVKLIFEESLVTYFTSFIFMGLLLLLFSYKNFTLPVRVDK